MSRSRSNQNINLVRPTHLEILFVGDMHAIRIAGSS